MCVRLDEQYNLQNSLKSKACHKPFPNDRRSCGKVISTTTRWLSRPKPSCVNRPCFPLNYSPYEAEMRLLMAYMTEAKDTLKTRKTKQPPNLPIGGVLMLKSLADCLFIPCVCWCYEFQGDRQAILVAWSDTNG